MEEKTFTGISGGLWLLYRDKVVAVKALMSSIKTRGTALLGRTSPVCPYMEQKGSRIRLLVDFRENCIFEPLAADGRR